MSDTQTHSANANQTFFPAKGFALVLLLGILFTGAVGVRLSHLGDPPLDFHPTRQYHSALIARAIYLEKSHAGSEEIKRVARAARPGTLEPPLMEYMVSWLYQIAGKESLIIPRMMSITFWTIAAVFLYLLALRSISPDAALVSVAFFLFLPFGIQASRSFQPDPLMIMTFLGAVLAIFSYRQTPSVRLLASSIAVSALAIFVKPVCIFPIWFAFFLTGVAKTSLWAMLRSASALLFFALSLLPTALFYGDSLFFGGALRATAQTVILPHLLMEGFYWRDWLHLAVKVIGYGALIPAVLSIPIAPSRLTKGLLAGLWCGYIVFGLVFTHNVRTHDYYHLLLIPIVALSLGVTAERVLQTMVSARTFWRWGSGAILVLILALYVYEAKQNLDRRGFASQVELFEEIGNRVEHSTKTVFLAPNYGAPLQYHGHLAGLDWPYVGDLRSAIHQIRKLQRRREHLASLFSTNPPQYFIVTDLAEFEAQPDLKKVLEAYPTLATTSKYQIYDLRTLENSK
jgi:hypothetical protein